MNSSPFFSLAGMIFGVSNGINHYASLEAELHDVFWDAEPSPELAWMDRLLGEHGGRAIEVGSGSGRLLLPLLEKGHELEGLEPSADMRRVCLERAAQQGLRPRIHSVGLERWEPDQRYEAIMIPAFTLQLCADFELGLRRAVDGLGAGGLLYLTLFQPFAEINGELPEGEWYVDQEVAHADGGVARVQTRHWLDRDAQVIEREHHYEWVKPDATVEHRSRQRVRWVEWGQLDEMLEKYEMATEWAAGDFDEAEGVGEESQILTLVASRETSR